MKNKVKPEVRHDRTTSCCLDAEDKFQWLNNSGRGEEEIKQKNYGNTYLKHFFNHVCCQMRYWIAWHKLTRMPVHGAV